MGEAQRRRLLRWSGLMPAKPDKGGGFQGCASKAALRGCPFASAEHQSPSTPRSPRSGRCESVLLAGSGLAPAARQPGGEQPPGAALRRGTAHPSKVTLCTSNCTLLQPKAPQGHAGPHCCASPFRGRPPRQTLPASPREGDSSGGSLL